MPFQSKFTNEELITFLTTDEEVVTSDNVKDAAEHFGVKVQSVTKRINKLPQFQKVTRGKWNLSVAEKLEKTFNAPAAPIVEQNLVPDKDPNYVPFGNFADVKKIISSKMFYPTFITGLSGIGKTFSVEQACAQLKRELIRVNITIETDEDDLIGGFRLVNGETVWHDGPVRFSFSTEEPSCSLTKLTLPVTKSSVSNPSLKVKEFSLRRLEDSSNLQTDSTSLPQQILKVRFR